MNNEITGLILDSRTISEADYIIGSDDNIEIHENTNTKRFYYNQGLEREPSTRWSCGLFAPMGALSDLTGIEYSEEDIKRVNESAMYRYGLNIGAGMYMSRGVDCIRDDYNTRNPNNQIISIRCKIGDKVFAEALRKKHSLIVGYKTSPEYYKDSQTDGIVTGEDFPKKGGHLVRSNFNENVIKIDDNYIGTKAYNTYTNNQIKKLKDNGVFFPSAYLFLYKKTMADKIRDNINLERAKIMFDLNHWNGLRPTEPMTREEVMAVIKTMLDNK